LTLGLAFFRILSFFSTKAQTSRPGTSAIIELVIVTPKSGLMSNPWFFFTFTGFTKLLPGFMTPTLLALDQN
jgi:hypothetical protein